MNSRKKPALGRNLSSMLSQTTLKQVQNDSRDELRNLPLDVIRPGRYQPRSVFDEDKLAELADSIRSQGVVQPGGVSSAKACGSTEKSRRARQGKVAWRMASSGTASVGIGRVRRVPVRNEQARKTTWRRRSSWPPSTSPWRGS